MRPVSSFIVFADESGDHGLARINSNYPIFVLSCCIFRKDEYIDRVCPALQRFKLRWWPHDAVVLHSAQIKGREPPFGILQEKGRRERFMSDLTRTLTAAVIGMNLLASRWSSSIRRRILLDYRLPTWSVRRLAVTCTVPNSSIWHSK